MAGAGRKLYRTRTPKEDESNIPGVPGVIRAAVDQLWPKDVDGRIAWKTGEAMAFLKEFFEAFDHPIPEAGKVMFHQMYQMVLMDAGCPAEEGLSKEQTGEFAHRCWEWAFEGLSQEMTQTRKSAMSARGSSAAPAGRVLLPAVQLEEARSRGRLSARA